MRVLGYLWVSERVKGERVSGGLSNENVQDSTCAAKRLWFPWAFDKKQELKIVAPTPQIVGAFSSEESIRTTPVPF